MCIGIPMQVSEVEPGFAYCRGRGEQRRISTLLVGDCVQGDWLLVFLGDAREKIEAARAAEINEVLDMLQVALHGASGAPDDMAVPDFILPSSMSGTEIAALTNQNQSRQIPPETIYQLDYLKETV